MTDAEREARDLKRALTTLTGAVRDYLESLDETMKLPDSNERGKRIAALANALNMANDRARYFGLKVDFRTDKKGARP